MRRVAILFAGQSTEHEISILSARNVLGLWGLSGLGPTQLVSRLIDLAIERFERRKNLRRTVRAR